MEIYNSICVFYLEVVIFEMKYFDYYGNDGIRIMLFVGSVDSIVKVF